MHGWSGVRLLAQAPLWPHMAVWMSNELRGAPKCITAGIIRGCAVLINVNIIWCSGVLSESLSVWKIATGINFQWHVSH